MEEKNVTGYKEENERGKKGGERKIMGRRIGKEKEENEKEEEENWRGELDLEEEENRRGTMGKRSRNRVSMGK